MLEPKKTGFAVGGFAGVVHVGWSLLVAFGLAQPLADFAFRVHMVAPIIAVQQFRIGTALLLVVVTSLVGFAAGFVFATVWNKVIKMK